MPIYTYECSRCGVVFETRQRFSDPRLEVHESCGGAVRRQLHAAGVIFKGSGFYTTDYRGGGNGSRAVPSSEEKSASSESGDGPATASEAKSEAKTESKAESSTGGSDAG